MKNIFTVCLMLCGLLFVSCGADQTESQKAAADRISSQVPDNPTPGAAPITPSSAATPPVEPPQNSVGVWHFTCPAGCSGGSGKAGPCASCGQTLAHNKIYHDTGANPATPPPAPAPGAFNVDGAAVPPPATPEPAQNATGVWHYTCTDGCSGGAGAAQACAGCGKTLVHNQTYHN